MSTPCWNCGSDLRVCIDCDLYNGKYIEIPNHATNGDVIKAIFPNTQIRENNSNFITYTLDGIIGTCVEKTWWNRPYKKGK